MNFRVFTFTFPDKLTEKQEDILIANLQFFRNKIVGELDKALEKLKSPRDRFLKNILNQRGMLDTMITRLTVLRNSADSLILLEKDSERVYRFIYPREELSVLSKNLKIAGKNFDLTVGDAIPEKDFKKWLELNAFKDMGIDPQRVKLEVSDKEVK